jgi:hypothetical protein
LEFLPCGWKVHAKVDLKKLFCDYSKGLWMEFVTLVSKQGFYFLKKTVNNSANVDMANIVEEAMDRSIIIETLLSKTTELTVADWSKVRGTWI